MIVLIVPADQVRAKENVTMLTRRWAIVCASALVALLGLAVLLNTGNAAKPAPPPNFGGSICYSSNQIWAMNGDGSANRAVTAQAPYDAWGNRPPPSNIDHNGHTWWLWKNTVTELDGTTHVELSAFRTVLDPTGAPVDSVWVPLQTASAGVGFRSSVSWSNDGADSFVSFVSYDGTLDKYFLCRAATSFAAGPPAAGPPQRVIEVPSDITPFHWSPDGGSVVFVNNGLWGYHVGDAAPTKITSDGNWPKWSPPGGPNRIAFESAYCIYTVAPDGSARTAAYDHEPWPSQDQGHTPFWSPDGKYLVFLNYVLKMGKGGVGTWPHQVAVIPWGGGSATIFATYSSGADLNGWRAATPLP
jgi:hypothetical protein